MRDSAVRMAPQFIAPIDISALVKLTAGNQSLSKELLAVFRDQAPAYLRALEQAGDDRAWTLAAHTLKGAAQSIAAAQVAELAQTAESLVGPRAAERAEIIRALKRALLDAKRFIDFQLLDAAD